MSHRFNRNYHALGKAVAKSSNVDDRRGSGRGRLSALPTAQRIFPRVGAAPRAGGGRSGKEFLTLLLWLALPGLLFWHKPMQLLVPLSGRFGSGIPF